MPVSCECCDLSGRCLCDRLIPVKRTSRECVFVCVCVCVCVCISELIRYKIHLLHIKWIGIRGQSMKAGYERNKRRKETVAYVMI